MPVDYYPPGGGSDAEIPSGIGQVTIFARTGSDQTAMSGSFAVDYCDFNTEVTDEPNCWTRTSAGLYTCSIAADWLIIWHFYSTSPGAYLQIVQNSVVDDYSVWGPGLGGAWQRMPFRVRTAANDTIRFSLISSAAYTLPYTDSVRAGKVNFIEIVRMK